MEFRRVLFRSNRREAAQGLDVTAMDLGGHRVDRHMLELDPVPVSLQRVGKTRAIPGARGDDDLLGGAAGFDRSGQLFIDFGGILSENGTGEGEQDRRKGQRSIIHDADSCAIPTPTSTMVPHVSLNHYKSGS